MEEPKISIVIPSIGRDSLLQTLRSVSEQYSKPYETLVVLNRNSPRFNDQVAHDTNSIFIYTTTGGVSDSRNIGANYATGQWILFLDDDDFLLPTAIASISKIIRNLSPDEISNRILSFQGYLIKQNRISRRYKYCQPSSEFYMRLFPFSWRGLKFGFFMGGIVLPKAICEQFKFPSNLNFREDVAWIISMNQSGILVHTVEIPVVAILRDDHHTIRKESLVSVYRWLRFLSFVKGSLVFRYVIGIGSRNQIYRLLINLNIARRKLKSVLIKRCSN